MSETKYPEQHAISRVGWLRAAVLGANDGIVSTASLLLGVAAAGTNRSEILIAGVAGLVAGAMSMAAGEYVSVSSQSDTERADLAREQAELDEQPEFEFQELVGIYRKRGLDAPTAERAARQMMDHDALGTHARDELGLNENVTARPLQAAFASAATFCVGAALPLLVVWLAPRPLLIPAVMLVSLVSLLLLGALGAKAGNAAVGKAMLRVGFWGMLAMALTAGIGRLTGAVV